MPRRFVVAWLTFALLFSVQLTGCSLIGFGIGSAIDSGRAVTLRPGEPVRILRLERGARVRLRMGDSTTVTGTYLGLDPETSAEYAVRYGAWRDTAALRFLAPAIGERVHFRAVGKHELNGVWKLGPFLGFGPRSLYLRDRGKAVAVPIEPLGDLTDAAGRKTPLSEILEVQDRLPIQAVVLVRDRDGTRHRVDLLDDRIVTAEFGGPNHGFRTAGLVIGIAGDVLIAAVLIAVATYEPPSCEPTYTGSYLRAGAIPDSLWLTPWARAALDPKDPLASR